jgi:hypothetical protein
VIDNFFVKPICLSISSFIDLIRAILALNADSLLVMVVYEWEVTILKVVTIRDDFLRYRNYQINFELHFFFFFAEMLFLSKKSKLSLVNN